MPRSGTKLPKSEATRLRLIDCAVAEIVESGPDRLGFTAIARRAGMSTGALYARYENSDELLLEVWLNRALPVLRELLNDLGEAVDKESGVAARLRIAQRLTVPDPELLLLANLLIVGRRNETLNEVIAPSFVDAMKKAAGQVPGLEIFFGVVLGIVLGSAGVGFIGLDWSGPVALTAKSVAGIPAHGGHRTDPDPEPETFFRPIDADEVEQRLFDAVAAVIAKVGVDRATVSRIARTADINPASIYLRYEDKDALFRSAVVHVMRMGSANNKSLVEKYKQQSRADQGGSEGAVAMFRGNASKGYESIRRLRLETMLAATHDPDLRRATNAIYLEAIAETEESVGAVKGSLTGGDGLPFITFSRFSFFGYATLCEYGLIDVDYPHFEAFAANIGRTMMKMYASSPNVTIPGK